MIYVGSRSTVVGEVMTIFSVEGRIPFQPFGRGSVLTASIPGFPLSHLAIYNLVWNSCLLFLSLVIAHTHAMFDPLLAFSLSIDAAAAAILQSSTYAIYILPCILYSYQTWYRYLLPSLCTRNKNKKNVYTSTTSKEPPFQQRRRVRRWSTVGEITFTWM